MASSNISLGKAIEEFMGSPSASYTMRFHLTRFSMVCGKECPMFALSPSDVKECLKETRKAADKRDRAQTLETFFDFAKGNGWVQSNIAAGLVKQPQKKPAVKAEKAPPPAREVVYLTLEGRYEMELEVEELMARKDKVIAEVAAAREEGDLKENAGYHDARERLGLIEGQIREKRDMLAKAVIKG